MRLRASVRPPKRLDSDLFYTPLSRRSLRENKEDTRPAYIDYNPNLPPAAFPTLERPRTPEPNDSQSHQVKDDTQCVSRQKCRDPSSNQNGRCVKVGGHKETGLDQDDIPTNLIDDYIASNGDLNPIYVSNMARMATAGQDSASMDKDMEDSDPEEVMKAHYNRTNGKSAAAIRNPHWGDLSERMQVEIFDNLLQNYSWASACHLLALTTRERETIQDLITYRTEQVNLEDSQLKFMRAKQLRELLKIDNSSWRRNRVPHYLVFRKISRQSARKLRESMATDYFWCEAGELVNAKRFLCRRGIDSNFAGDWSNNMILMPTEENADLEMDDFGENLGMTVLVPAANSTTEDTQSPSPGDDSHPRMPISRNRAFINSIGEETVPSTTELQQRRGDLNVPSRWVALLYQDCIEPLHIYRLRVGVEKGADIRKADRDCISPEKMHLRPPLDYPFINEMPQGFGPLNKALRPSTPTFDNLQQRPERTRDTALSEDRPVADHARRDSSSMRLRERLDEARRYARRPNRPRVYQLEDDGLDAELLGPQQPRIIPLPRSPSTTPGRLLSPTGSEDAFFPFSDCLSPLHTPEHCTPPLEDSFCELINSDQSNSSMELVMPDRHTSRSSPTRGCLPSPEGSHGGNQSETEEEDDDEWDHEEDDEILLIPDGMHPLAGPQLAAKERKV